MKRMYKGSIAGCSKTSHPAPKRPRISPGGVPKVGGLKVYDLPPHHYHLGNNKFVVVSDFKNSVKIHIRSYRKEEDLYYPTKTGITVSVPAFQKFSQSLNFMEFSFGEGNDKDCVHIFRQEFLISRRTVDFKSSFVFQRVCETDQGLCKVLFSPTIYLNSEEFEHLFDVCPKVMESALELLFSRVFLKAVLGEKENTPTPMSDPDNAEDSEIALSSLLSETLLSAIKVNINQLFVCLGCVQNQANQLGHECVTTSNEIKADRYFDQAVADLDVHALAKDFVKNASFYLNFLSEDFLSGVSLQGLFKTIRDHYVQEYAGF